MTIQLLKPLCQSVRIVPFVFDSRLHNVIQKCWWILTSPFLPSFVTQLCNKHDSFYMLVFYYCILHGYNLQCTACCYIPALTDSFFWICRQLHVLDETYVMNQVRKDQLHKHSCDLSDVWPSLLPVGFFVLLIWQIPVSKCDGYKSYAANESIQSL